MNLTNIIKQEYNNLLLESLDIKNIPNEIKELINGYDLFMDFDWNKKQDEYVDDEGNYDGEGFINWFNNYQNEQLKLKLDSLISKVRKDMILFHKRKIASKKLEAFEELIIPVLGNSVLIPVLSKFEETVLLDPNASIEDIEKGFKEAKSIIDRDGSINMDKVTPSTLFSGDHINKPNFEKFVKDNPEYKGVYNDWLKLFYNDINLSIQDTNTSQTISIEDMRKLYNYLNKFKNKTK